MEIGLDFLNLDVDYRCFIVAVDEGYNVPLLSERLINSKTSSSVE